MVTRLFQALWSPHKAMSRFGGRSALSASPMLPTLFASAEAGVLHAPWLALAAFGFGAGALLDA
jgi:hypothetical protein